MKIFEQLFSVVETWTEVRFTQLWAIANFEHKHFTV